LEHYGGRSAVRFAGRKRKLSDQGRGFFGLDFMSNADKGAAEWLRDKRRAAGIGLREFAVLIGESPANWCNFENGRRKAPQNDAKLRKIAQVLGIREHSEDWETLFGIVRRPNRPPADVEKYAQLELVPTLLRTIGERRLNRPQMERIIKYVNKNFGKPKEGDEKSR
jgi:transcriptional regulator with XRE-family HTH domain